MRLVIRASPAETARLAAEQVASLVGNGNGGVLGLATGSSPRPLYEALVDLVAHGRARFTRTIGFALDEYVGIDVTHPQSYHSIIARDVVGPLGFDPLRVRLPSGTGSLAEVDAGALDYDEAIRTAGGIDVQILGIGANGHIGFNEPGSEIDSVTRRVDLAHETIEANSRFFASTADVPSQAVSQGIGTILRARSVVLVATGSLKASAVRAAVEGPVDSSCPASFLQRHRDVTLYLDAAAAGQTG
jgi:glucosamine-6-phosphate deaminase